MIPKIIHYCWFGGAPLSELALNALKVGKKLVQIMRLGDGMSQILI